MISLCVKDSEEIAEPLYLQGKKKTRSDDRSVIVDFQREKGLRRCEKEKNKNQRKSVVKHHQKWKITDPVVFEKQTTVVALLLACEWFCSNWTRSNINATRHGGNTADFALLCNHKVSGLLECGSCLIINVGDPMVVASVVAWSLTKKSMELTDLFKKSFIKGLKSGTHFRRF